MTLDLNNVESLSFTREPLAVSSWDATVPYDDDLESFRHEPVRLYYDTQFLYRGRVQQVTSSTRDNTTQISGLGPGDELNRGEGTESYSNINAWAALEHYLDTHSPISKGTFTEPSPLSSVSNQDLFSYTSDEEWKDHVQVPDGQGGYAYLYDDDGTRSSAVGHQPFVVQNGGVEVAQTCFFIEAEDPDRDNSGRLTTGSEDDGFSGAQGWVLETTGDWVEYDFTNEYTIPEDSFGVNARLSAGDTNAWEVTITLEDGTSQTVDNVTTGATFIALGWDDVGDGQYDGSGWSSGDVPPGTHTIRFECTDGGAAGEQLFIDCLAPYDQRFTYTFDNTVDGNNALSGPEVAPQEAEFFLDANSTSFQLTTVRIDADFNDFSGGQHMDYSVNEADDFEGPFNNTETVEDDPVNTGSSVFTSITVGHYTSGTPTTTPTSGNARQKLNDISVDFDGEDIAVITDMTADGTHKENIDKLAQRAGMRYVIDFDETDVWIDAFRRGERVGEPEWTVLDHERTLDVHNYANKIVAKGARQDDDTRISSTAEDADEIAEWGEQQWTDIEVDIDNQDDLDAFARAMLEQRLAEDVITGKLWIAPEPITPGYSYPVGLWDEEVPQGGYALRFRDGESDYVRIRDASTFRFDPNNDDITISFWLRPDAVSGDVGILHKGGEGTYHIDLNDGGGIDWTVKPTNESPVNNVQTSSIVSVDETVWVSCEFDHTSGLTVYVDEAEIESASQTFSGADQDTFDPDMWFGRGFSPESYYGGIMDDIQFHSKVLSDAERNRIHNRGVVQDSLIARYQFESGSGSTALDTVGGGGSWGEDWGGPWGGSGPEDGEITGATWVGTEVPLERVRYTVGSNRLSGELEFKRPAGLGESVVDVASDAQSTRDAI